MAVNRRGVKLVNASDEQLRRTLLEVIEEQNRAHVSLQSASILSQTRTRLGIRGTEPEQALLAYFGDLFRVGYLAWGTDLANPNPPFCHVTRRGRDALARLGRDPANPDGYLAYLRTVATLAPISESYIREALAAFQASCPKAASVMVGAAVESVVLGIRDELSAKLGTLGRPTPKRLADWRMKRILDELGAILTASRQNMPRDVGEAFDAYWSPFTQQARIARNAAGHPTSLDPLQDSAAHAALLIFPELLSLAERLRTWVRTSYT